MKRRQLLSYATTTAATSVTLNQLSSQVKAQSLPNIRWKLTTSWPTSLDTLYGAAQTVARRVKEMTNGQFTL